MRSLICEGILENLSTLFTQRRATAALHWHQCQGILENLSTQSPTGTAEPHSCIYPDNPRNSL